MRRDMETVRRILIAVADADAPVRIGQLETETDSLPKVAEHVRMLIEAGYLIGSVYTDRGISGRVERLTWDGQDFLAAIEEPRVWERVRGRLRDMGGDCAVEVVKAMAVKAAVAVLEQWHSDL